MTKPKALKKNLKSGTNYTSSQLTAKQICSIIKTSAKVKVRLFSYGDLRLEFGEVSPARDSWPVQNVLPTSPAEAALSDKEHEAQTKESIFIEELRLKEDTLEQMFIEDPLEAERLIESGELDEDDGQEEAYD